MGGLCHLCFLASAATITTYSDTKCKVQLPSKSLPIIKGPWVAVLPPLQLLSDYWVWGELRRQSAAKHRGPRGLGGKKIKSKTLQKINQRRTSGPQLQAIQPGPCSSKSCRDFRQKRLLVFIGGNRCWVALNGTVMQGGGGGAGGAGRRPPDPGLPRVPLHCQRDAQKPSHTLSPFPPVLMPYSSCLNPKAVPWTSALNSTWTPTFHFSDIPLNISITADEVSMAS